MVPITLPFPAPIIINIVIAIILNKLEQIWAAQKWNTPPSLEFHLILLIRIVRMGEDSSPAAKTGTQDFSEDLLPREDIFFNIVKWHLSQFFDQKIAFPGQHF